MARPYAAGVALALLALLAGCTDGDDGGSEDPGPSPSAAQGPGSGSPTPDDSASPATSGSAAPAAPGSAAPAAGLLDWQPTGEPVDAAVVVGRQWRAVVPAGGRRAVLSGGGERVRIPAGRGFRIDQVLMSDDHAVVVAQDKAERRPAKGLVMDLDSGDRGPVPGPLPAPGGSWTLHDDELRYPTTGRRGAYCLAAVHLPSAESQLEHCAGKGEGFSRVTTSDHGTALMTFDDTRPVSCRTLVVLTDVQPAPVEGVPECRGWDVVATATGAAWSALGDEQRVEEGDFSATHDGEVVPLGRGATGTLVPCGDSAFFATARSADTPPRLLRWTPDGELEVAYEASGTGRGFLTPPACADDVLTLTLLSEDGDEQLWATVD